MVYSGAMMENTDKPVDFWAGLKNAQDFYHRMFMDAIVWKSGDAQNWRIRNVLKKLSANRRTVNAGSRVGKGIRGHEDVYDPDLSGTVIGKGFGPDNSRKGLCTVKYLIGGHEFDCDLPKGHSGQHSHKVEKWPVNIEESEPITKNEQNGNSMEPYQERVVEEKGDLDEKIKRLVAFIKGDTFCDVGDDERLRLLHQKGVMAMYSAALGERIKYFK